MNQKTVLLMLYCCMVPIMAFSGNKQMPASQPLDLEFKSMATVSNPFAIEFWADFTGPGGIRLTLPGFYDGNGLWKVRFSTAKAGIWTLVTHASLPDLDGRKLEFRVTANANKIQHGGLRVDTDHPHHFVYEDGTHWFPAGYECNWLWALDETDDQLPTVNSFLDKLSSFGFNLILVNAYCYDTNWRPGKSAPDDYGPSALYPWEGTNDKPDFSRFDVAYWQHFDKIVQVLYEHGMSVHLYLKVYNKKVNWPQNNSPEDDRYYRWVIARYAAYPNMIWDLAKEANYERSVAYKVGRLKFIRGLDPYHHLLTVHTDVQTYDGGAYDQLVDFRSHQEQSDHLHTTALKQLAQNHWPVFNVESGYEQGPKGPDDKTYAHAESPKEVALRIWQIQMAGCYNAYYYTYTAWDVIRTADTPPGYLYLKYFRDFFARTKYWELKSADSLVNAGYCLSNAGKEYVVFQNKASPFSLDLSSIKTPLKARWYHPYTGAFEDGGIVKRGTVRFTPPATSGNGPVVLHLQVRAF
jgi:hypothetical protein